MPAGNDGVYGPADNFLRRFKHLHGSYGEAVLRSSLSCCNAAYRHALNLFDITQRAQSALEVQPVQTARVDLEERSQALALAAPVATDAHQVQQGQRPQEGHAALQPDEAAQQAVPFSQVPLVLYTSLAGRSLLP